MHNEQTFELDLHAYAWIKVYCPLVNLPLTGICIKDSKHFQHFYFFTFLTLPDFNQLSSYLPWPILPMVVRFFFSFIFRFINFSHYYCFWKEIRENEMDSLCEDLKLGERSWQEIGCFFFPIFSGMGFSCL